MSLAIPITLFFLLTKPVAINSEFSVSNKEPLYFGHDNIPVCLELFRQTCQG
nr:hypothetical protein [Enterobacter asburiae]UHA81948.1 hypothetical protein [Enterobacter cloacae]